MGIKSTVSRPIKKGWSCAAPNMTTPDTQLAGVASCVDSEQLKFECVGLLPSVSSSIGTMAARAWRAAAVRPLVDPERGDEKGGKMSSSKQRGYPLVQ